MFCVNLCEIYSPHFLRKINLEFFLDFLSSKMGEKIERIYIGSSFCSQYFLKLSDYESIFQLCKKRRICITLTIPVFTEKDVGAGKEKANVICQSGIGVIDEITVNDIGMLSYFQDKKSYQLNLGRLFFKDPRDCRVPDFYNKKVSPLLLSHLSDAYWRMFRFSAVELDPTNKELDMSFLEETDINFGVHFPFCYMTTGNICKFASIHRDVKQKFRPNLKCRLECAHICDYYSGHVAQTNCDPTLLRLGRTLYFEIDTVNCLGKTLSRVIYFPIKEWRKFTNENSGSIK